MSLSFNMIFSQFSTKISEFTNSNYQNLEDQLQKQIHISSWAPSDAYERKYQSDINKEKYRIIKFLGKGHYGKVYLCQHTETSELVAIKIIKKTKNRIANNRLTSEILCLKNLKNKDESIINYINNFENEKNTYIVLEYFDGCELFDEIIRRSKFTESDAKNLMKSLFTAVNEIHNNGITHTDLKPENILFNKDKGIKLLDFGLSKFDPLFNKTKELKTYKSKDGTPYYIAPEVLGRNYTRTCDIWSCGIIMFILLCGYPPFNSENEDDIVNVIFNPKNNVEFDEDDWDSISTDAIDLIEKCLDRDFVNRISAENVLKHRWFS